MKATRETPYGQIAVEWHRNGDDVVFNVEIPVGMTVKFACPEVKRIVKIDGKKRNAANAELQLKSGNHRIECRM